MSVYRPTALSGTGAGQLTLTASAAGLAKGVYSATVLIQTASAAPEFTSVPVVLVVGGSANIAIVGASNGASYKTVFAPGMIMSVFGTNLAPAAQHAPSVPLSLGMQGVTATVNGFAAPLLDVTPGQLNIQIPYETGGATAILGVLPVPGASLGAGNLHDAGWREQPGALRDGPARPSPVCIYHWRGRRGACADYREGANRERLEEVAFTIPADPA